MESLHVYMSHLCSISKLNALKAPHGQCVYECELGVHVHAGCFCVLLCICVCLNAVIFLCDHRSYLSLYVSVCVAGASFMVCVACVAHMASVVCIGSAASAVYMESVVYMAHAVFLLCVVCRLCLVHVWYAMCVSIIMSPQVCLAIILFPSPVSNSVFKTSLILTFASFESSKVWHQQVSKVSKVSKVCNPKVSSVSKVYKV